MPTTVVLLRGGPNPDEARELIDFLLSKEVEGRMASAGAHMPLRAGVETPPNIRGLGELRAMAVNYATVAAQLEGVEPWLRKWVGL
jgi:iron(III) transport system substrate-binding protein